MFMSYSGLDRVNIDFQSNMATFGKIDEFNVKDDWSQYIERLGPYFSANDITDM